MLTNIGELAVVVIQLFFVPDSVWALSKIDSEFGDIDHHFDTTPVAHLPDDILFSQRHNNSLVQSSGEPPTSSEDVAMVTTTETTPTAHQRSILVDVAEMDPSQVAPSRSPYFEVFEPEANDDLMLPPLSLDMDDEPGESDEYFIAEIANIHNGSKFSILNLTNSQVPSLETKAQQSSTATSGTTFTTSKPPESFDETKIKPCLEINGEQIPIKQLIHKKGDDGSPELDIKVEPTGVDLCRKIAVEEIEKRSVLFDTLQHHANGACKGSKGDKGEPSTITFSIGMPGPKGEKGDSARPHQRHHSPTSKGEKGDRGPPGPSANGGMQIFRTKQDLRLLTDRYQIGTLAFVLDEQSLMLKVSAKSWRVVLLGATESMMEDTSTSMETAPFSAMIQNEDEAEALKVISSSRLHLAAIDFPVSGQLGGVGAYDGLCQREAKRLGVAGYYQAFMASSFVNLRSLINFHPDLSVPIVNIKNQKLFDSWGDIFEGDGGLLRFHHHHHHHLNRHRLHRHRQRRHYHVPKLTIYTFGGYDIFKNPENRFKPKERFIWHGANSTGHTVHASNCDTWRQSSKKRDAISTGRGSPVDSRHRAIVNERDFDCSRRGIVLCIETTSQKSPAAFAQRQPMIQKMVRNMEQPESYFNSHTHFRQRSHQRRMQEKMGRRSDDKNGFLNVEPTHFI